MKGDDVDVDEVREIEPEVGGFAVVRPRLRQRLSVSAVCGRRVERKLSEGLRLVRSWTCSIART